VTVVHQSEDFRVWLESLERSDRKAVNRLVTLLEMKGVTLGEPHSSALRGSRFPLRELRPKGGASPLQVIYAFAPRREALVLLGGNKASEASSYRRAIARGEASWLGHLERLDRENLS